MKTGKSEYPSVHRGILLAADSLLRQRSHPAASWYSEEDVKILADEVIKPDQKGDRQRGSGYHYYCAVNPKGQRRAFVTDDYYPNGRGKKSPSARTMFEEEYAAARVSLEKGERKAAMEHLGRAAHMLADVYCPPHSCGLTYLSWYAGYHKRFETLAARMFWADRESLGEQEIIERVAKRVQQEINAVPYGQIAEQGAGNLFNGAAQRSAAVLPSVLGRDRTALEKAVQAQLSLAIGETAALLAAFAACGGKAAP